MLNTELHDAAEAFIAAVQQSDVYDAFTRTRTEFQGDPELRAIRKHFNERSTELQTKQSTGALSQEEIDELRALQSSVNTHPATARYIQARQSLVASLQECNRGLSQELGFDFASAAARQSCCG